MAAIEINPVISHQVFGCFYLLLTLTLTYSNHMYANVVFLSLVKVNMCRIIIFLLTLI